MKCSKACVRVAVAALAIAVSLPTFAGSGSCATKPDINKAEATELTCLKGVGPKMAEEIVAYRKAHGNFKSVSDLAAVPGVGKRAVKLEPFVTIGDTKSTK